ncbi:MAG: hypothetical protein A2Y94_13820 [Caldithrix sp. RBG_13_44_9]|nr:MAG: hypothetical protein A2Y94_13820 [Caldithrix sp. RBG_13_44_9]
MPEKISRIIIVHLQEFDTFWMVTVSGFNRRRRIRVKKRRFMRTRIVLATAIGMIGLLQKVV